MITRETIAELNAITKQKKELEKRDKELRAQILQEMIDKKSKEIKTDFAVISLVHAKQWEYPADVLEKHADLLIEKKKIESNIETLIETSRQTDAKCTEVPHHIQIKEVKEE
jgi:vacuolar-type H+-ATPase subunit I/STV1